MNVSCGGGFRKGPAGRQVAAVCRICVGLEKRVEGFAEETGSEVGERIRCIKVGKKVGSGCPGGPDKVQPPVFVFEKEVFPTVDCRVGYFEGHAQVFNRHGVGEIQMQDV